MYATTNGPAPFEGSSSSVLAASSSVVNGSRTAPPPPRPRYGGAHEFSIAGDISRRSGPVWGYRQDVDYQALRLRYSRVMMNGRHIVLSYSPEVIPYARIDEPILNNNDLGTVTLGRKHTIGGGVTPVSFTVALLPGHHIQPFWEANYGILYFRDRVLTPQGSQFMHNVDFGAGVHVFESRLVATTVGFRYTHMSNANISLHNPGTDAETWYLGFSRFHSPRSRQTR